MMDHAILRGIDFKNVSILRQHAYVEQGFYRYLDCGDLYNGFARVKCKDCGHEYLLAFSCKCCCFQ